jgi:uncharacterized protein YukE
MGDNYYHHEVFMDFPAANASQESIMSSIDKIEAELIRTDLLMHSDLRSTWLGDSAVEFFGLYDPAYKTMINLLDHMREMNRRFNVEIKDWEDMALHLANA